MVIGIGARYLAYEHILFTRIPATPIIRIVMVISRPSMVIISPGLLSAICLINLISSFVSRGYPRNSQSVSPWILITLSTTSFILSPGSHLYRHLLGYSLKLSEYHLFQFLNRDHSLRDYFSIYTSGYTCLRSAFTNDGVIP